MANIKTSFSLQPIPIRSFDWGAWDDETYCCPDCSPTGQGATEQEAINDLLERLSGEPYEA